jgi:ABC-2 type transport system permease protein
MVVLGAAYGGVGDEIEDFASDSEATADILEDLGVSGASLSDNYFAAICGIFGILVAGYAVQALLRLRSEETSAALESVLATSVSRPTWMASHIVIAGLGTVAILALTGLATGLTYGLIIDDVAGQAGRLTWATVVQAPAVWVVAGFVVAVFGLLPRHVVALAWAGFTLVLLVGQFGELFGLPGWVRNLSPFTWLPLVPLEDVTTGPLLLLIVVAAALVALGVAAIRRRDLALS